MPETMLLAMPANNVVASSWGFSVHEEQLPVDRCMELKT